MAVVAVAADVLRADSMDTAANVSDIGGGAGSGLEPDIVYQGVGAISRKVSTALRGFGTNGGSARDMTAARRKTAIFKIAIGNWSALNVQAAPGSSGLELRLGSGTAAYYAYTTSLFDAYQAAGGYMFFAIDPNVSVHRDGTTGSPNLASANWFAIAADLTASSKAENVAMDALDIGAGINLTGGDGGSADGVFQDFIDTDEGTSGNRWGFVTSKEGILFALGKIWIGQNTSQASVATGFTDSNATVVWPDGLFAADFSGLGLDLGNASTLIDLTSCTLIGRGTTTGVDTRPTLDVTGTSGAATLTGVSFIAWQSLNLTSAATLAGCSIIASGQIVAAGADLAGSSVSGSTAASALLWNTAADPVGELDDMSFTSAGTGHAIELGTNTPATITLTGHSYSGYASSNGSTGNEVLYNNSGKAITLNYNGDAPTVRNGTGASTTLVNSISWTIKLVDDAGVAVTGAEITVTDDAATPNVLFHVESTVSGTEVYSFDGSSAGNAAIILVIKSGVGAKEPFALDTVHPSGAQSTTVQLAVDRTEDNPA